MEKIFFKVMRFDPFKDRKPRMEKYEVPLAPFMTVLDGLFYIQGYIDGSLAFRSSCRAGVCGSCTVHINGKYRLACETQLKNLNSDTVVVLPMAHMPVIKDLFVDMTKFWKHYKEIRPYLIPGSPPPEKERHQSIDQRKKLDGLIDCILCGSCYAACDVAGTDSDYKGPAALLKANRFFQDSRDCAKVERIELVDGEHGIWRCRSIFNCQIVCPKDLDPAGNIMALKRAAIPVKI